MGGIIIVSGIIITFISPLILLDILGNRFPITSFDSEFTQLFGIAFIVAGVVFSVGVFITGVGKVLWERE
jgi:hypothetical protein